MRLFNPEGKFAVTMTKLYDLVAMNLMFLVTSIPLITIGANITAMYSVTLKMAKNQESYFFKSYWTNFKENFKKSTILWIIYALIGIFLIADFLVAGQMGSTFIFFRYLIGVALAVWIMSLSYVFPLQARFDNDIKIIAKNALLLPIRHLPWTILILLINALPLAGFLFLPGVLGAIFTFILFLAGFSGTAFASSYVFANKIFPYYVNEK